MNWWALAGFVVLLGFALAFVLGRSVGRVQGSASDDRPLPARGSWERAGVGPDLGPHVLPVVMASVPVKLTVESSLPGESEWDFRRRIAEKYPDAKEQP